MDVECLPKSQRRRWRWTVRTLMLLVAICAVACLLIRPDKPAQMRLAMEIIKKHMPWIDLKKYDASVVGMTPDGNYWIVQFVENTPRAEKPDAFTATIPDARVQELNRSSWRSRLPWNRRSSAPGSNSASRTGKSPLVIKVKPPLVIATPPPAAPNASGESP